MSLNREQADIYARQLLELSSLNTAILYFKRPAVTPILKLYGHNITRILIELYDYAKTALANHYIIGDNPYYPLLIDSINKNYPVKRLAVDLMFIFSHLPKTKHTSPLIETLTEADNLLRAKTPPPKEQLQKIISKIKTHIQEKDDISAAENYFNMILENTIGALNYIITSNAKQYIPRTIQTEGECAAFHNYIYDILEKNTPVEQAVYPKPPEHYFNTLRMAYNNAKKLESPHSLTSLFHDVITILIIFVDMMCNKQLEVHDEKEKPLHRIAEKLLSCTKRPMDEQYYKEAFLSNTISYWIDLYYRATEQTSNSIPKEKLYEAMKPYADILLHSMKATINTGYNLKISGNLKLIENRLAEIKNPKLAIDMSASVYEDAKDDSSEEVETEAPKTPTELEAIQNWGKDMPLAGSTESDDTVVGGEIA